METKGKYCREREKKGRTNSNGQSCQECSQTPYFVGKNVKFCSHRFVRLFSLSLTLWPSRSVAGDSFFSLQWFCSFVRCKIVVFLTCTFCRVFVFHHDSHTKFLVPTKSWWGERKIERKNQILQFSLPHFLLCPLLSLSLSRFLAIVPIAKSSIRIFFRHIDLAVEK